MRATPMLDDISRSEHFLFAFSDYFELPRFTRAARYRAAFHRFRFGADFRSPTLAAFPRRLHHHDDFRPIRRASRVLP